MFGSFRIILALLVVIGHLHGPHPLGNYAVFGFYVLSGYLMTYIMNETYGFHLRGRVKFVLNRFLRIFPSYWVAALISICLLFIFGVKITEFHGAIQLPDDYVSWARNIFLIFSFNSYPRLSPATWALTVELFFYAAICIGVSRTKRVSLIWVFGSIFYTFYLCFSGADWGDRYFPILAASLPFSLGSLLFHYNKELDDWPFLRKITTPIILLLLICMNFCVNYLVSIKWLASSLFGLGFYLNLVLIMLMIAALARVQVASRLKSLDTMMGKFSYPIYLTHWQAGALIYVLSGTRLKASFFSLGGLLFLVLAMLTSILFSYVIIKFIDDPIELKRKKIKANKDA